MSNLERDELFSEIILDFATLDEREVNLSPSDRNKLNYISKTIQRVFNINLPQVYGVWNFREYGKLLLCCSGRDSDLYNNFKSATQIIKRALDKFEPHPEFDKFNEILSKIIQYYSLGSQ